MNLTAQTLVALGATQTDANRFIEPLKALCALRDLSTPARVAGLLGQCFVESKKLSDLEEDLYYKTAARLKFVYKSFFKTEEQAAPYLRNPEKLANLVYAGRYGNGDTASGDGYRYRGRGLIQTTFHANYADAEKDTGRPYLSQPDLLLEPSDAVQAAVSYYIRKGGVAHADRLDWDGVTRCVNPAMLEKEVRFATSVKAMGLLAQ